MTWLSHSPAQTEQLSRQTRYASGKRVSGVATATHWTTIKRFCLVALTILLAGGTLAGIVALKTLVYLPHFNY
jgi:hypothetical protein